MTVKRVRIETHTRDGVIDWDAYHAAEKQNGELCQECGTFILTPLGHPSSCNCCLDLARNNGEATHEKWVRCPACNYHIDPNDDYFELFEEGENEVSCPECEYDFTVSTHVSHSFTSPPRVPTTKDEDG